MAVSEKYQHQSLLLNINNIEDRMDLIELSELLMFCFLLTVIIMNIIVSQRTSYCTWTITAFCWGCECHVVSFRIMNCVMTIPYSA